MSTAQTFPKGSPEAFLATCQPLTAKITDIDLVGAARAILAKHVNNDPVKLHAFDASVNIQIANGLTTEVQRYKLNMFLNLQYSALKGDISMHRAYILSDGDAATWLKMFDTYHAPTMVACGLPVVI